MRGIAGLPSPLPSMLLSPIETRSPLLVIAVPGDEAAKPFLDRRVWLEVDGVLKIGHVGERLDDVARLHRHELAYGRSSDRRLQRAHELGQFDRPIVADVVETP